MEEFALVVGIISGILGIASFIFPPINHKERIQIAFVVIFTVCAVYYYISYLKKQEDKESKSPVTIENKPPIVRTNDTAIPVQPPLKKPEVNTESPKTPERQEDGGGVGESTEYTKTLSLGDDCSFEDLINATTDQGNWVEKNAIREVNGFLKIRIPKSTKKVTLHFTNHRDTTYEIY